jgi:ribonucleoside-diphosphate reductase alpha chain
VWSDVDGKRYAMLPSHFVTALDMSALDHMRMSAAVQPWIDSAISKTVNVPADYPFADFEDLYLLRGRRTQGHHDVPAQRVLGAVLSVPMRRPREGRPRPDRPRTDACACRRSRSRRSRACAGRAGRSFPTATRAGRTSCAIRTATFAGVHRSCRERTPRAVRSVGQRRRAARAAWARSPRHCRWTCAPEDRRWLDKKLSRALRARRRRRVRSRDAARRREVSRAELVAGFAALVRYRCNELGAFDDASASSPVMDALMAPKEPKAGTDGTLSWTVDVVNPATGDDFAMFLKELVMPDGQRRPYSMWLSGEYPRAFDGLCKALSLDMRVTDPAWIAMKLRKLLNYGESNGAFMARTPARTRARRILRPSLTARASSSTATRC